MADEVSNFAFSTVATAPSPATTGTSLVVASGEGTLFPTAPFNAVVYPSDADPSASNAEIVRVTAVSTDTLTITREQESTSARTIVTGDRIHAGVTKELMEQFTAKSLFDAHSILAANSDNTPSALTVAASRIVARGASGNIDAKTLSEVLDFVGSAADGDILMRSSGSWTRLAKGTDGQVLTLASGLPSWAAAGGGGGVWSLLEEVACASQTYIEFDGNGGTTYDDLTDTDFEEFRIEFDGVVPSSSGYGVWYVIDNGSRVTSGVYNHNDIFRDDANNAQTTTGKTSNQAYIWAKTHNTSGVLFGHMLIPRWSGTTYPMAAAEIYHWNTASVIGQSRSIGGIDGTYSTIEGISLKMSSGNWGTSGSVKLYGRAA